VLDFAALFAFRYLTSLVEQDRERHLAAETAALPESKQ